MSMNTLAKDKDLSTEYDNFKAWLFIEVMMVFAVIIVNAIYLFFRAILI